jgi:pimeloyl-ACP methyl ester carboxylesterase
MPKIESLLSARLFLVPQLVEDKIYFLSNLSGRLSLYRMDYGGSIPEPLLPPDISLQNPHLMEGESFHVFPTLGKIIVMIDMDGDENYQPMFIPIEGGFPEAIFDDQLSDFRVFLVKCHPESYLVYLTAGSRKEQVYVSFQGNLETRELTKLCESVWNGFPIGVSEDDCQVVLADEYTIGDNVLYLWTSGRPDLEPLYGKPLEERKEYEPVALNSISSCQFTNKDGLLFITSLFEDTYGLGYLKLDRPDSVVQVPIQGKVHTGFGELINLDHIQGDRYLFSYNIDGCSWLYEGVFEEENLRVELDKVICGRGALSKGVVERHSYDKSSDRLILSFSTAISPTQIYTVEGEQREIVVRHTNERVLGIDDYYLSEGEVASFYSFDGTRISARLYLPSPALGFSTPYPLVYYIHGGPHDQERPDFAWFSMPLIQFLTLSGFAVFVPNVRGSTGYGLDYTKEVDRDWGGKDRLDHVHAMTEVLPKDQRIDASRAGVVGRSYGGYMSLTLASRHPDLWSAAVDMFGPYDLLTFMDRIPETWKPYYAIAVGDPVRDRELLIDRSPRTYMADIICPMLVIQGRNDPRVVARESQDVVDYLRSQGKNVDLLIFENEGHDVLKYENRVTCYNTITDFFKLHLKS